MSHLKCANSLKAITTNFRRILFVSNKSLCSKKVKDFNVTIKIDDGKAEKKKSRSILFDEDDETGTVVVTEREKEASVKSRLSKECNKIYGEFYIVKYVHNLISVGLKNDAKMSIHLEFSADGVVEKISLTNLTFF